MKEEFGVHSYSIKLKYDYEYVCNLILYLYDEDIHKITTRKYVFRYMFVELIPNQCGLHIPLFLFNCWILGDFFPYIFVAF